MAQIQFTDASALIYRILQKRAELALIGKVRPHDLRRTFATRMLEQGCDLFILQRSELLMRFGLKSQFIF